MAIPDNLIIELDSIDSTNNYAMRLIDANKSQHGLTITALNQLAGKGQRGKTWQAISGQSLLMTIIVTPGRPIGGQYVFNALVAVAIANVLQKLNDTWQVHIKWPNDIIVNDKKAGGILIENVLRGSQWSNSVIGLGLNVLQDFFPDELPFATSLKRASGVKYNVNLLRDDIRQNILDAVIDGNTDEVILAGYNQLLYRRGLIQEFKRGNEIFEARILQVDKDGTLAVQMTDGAIVNLQHGVAFWEWPK